MMHSTDPWSPKPTPPDGQGTTERQAEPQALNQPKPEAAQNESQSNQEQSATTAIHSAKALAPAQQKPRAEKPSALARAIGAARLVLPVVQKALPLLEGNVAMAAANFLTPSPRPVDLEPVRTAIGKLQADHRTLRGQAADQKALLNSIEAELTSVKESIDRNDSEIRELAEAQLNLSRRLTRLVWMIFILLTLSIAFTTLVCVRLAYILRL